MAGIPGEVSFLNESWSKIPNGSTLSKTVSANYSEQVCRPQFILASGWWPPGQLCSAHWLHMFSSLSTYLRSPRLVDPNLLRNSAQWSELQWLHKFSSLPITQISFAAIIKPKPKKIQLEGLLQNRPFKAVIRLTYRGVSADTEDVPISRPGWLENHTHLSARRVVPPQCDYCWAIKYCDHVWARELNLRPLLVPK